MNKEEKPTPATTFSQVLKSKEKAKQLQRTSTPALSVKKASFSCYPKEKTPPPPTKREKHPMGYLYTQEEKDWAEKYLFILFKRDPIMSHSAAARVLHRHVRVFIAFFFQLH
jgi:hypothetical protein